MLALTAGLVVAAGAWALAAAPLLRVAVPLLADGPGALAATGFADVLAGGCATALLACTGWLVATGALLVLTHLGRLLAPDSPTWARLGGDRRAGVPGRDPRRGHGAARRRGRGGGDRARLGRPQRRGGRRRGSHRPGPPGPGDGRGPARRPGRATRSAPWWSVRATRSGRSPPACCRPARSDRAVDAGWRALHAANRVRVGPDPDLLRPGTRLDVPDLLTHAPHGEELP